MSKLARVITTICTSVGTGVVLGGLIGEATALSSGTHHHALAIGILIGAACGIGAGVMVAVLWNLDV